MTDFGFNLAMDVKFAVRLNEVIDYLAEPAKKKRQFQRRKTRQQLDITEEFQEFQKLRKTSFYGKESDVWARVGADYWGETERVYRSFEILSSFEIPSALLESKAREGASGFLPDIYVRSDRDFRLHEKMSEARDFRFYVRGGRVFAERTGPSVFSTKASV